VGGKVLTDFGGGPIHAWASTDGKSLSLARAAKGDFAVARYNPSRSTTVNIFAAECPR
jgi:hypothetical protein